jgi:hypothetical protein
VTGRSQRERLTACLIVQDEQERLPGALQSVAFCDEVVVVDGGSRDGTVEVARRTGARVLENPWPGFAIQRNLALDAASGEWVLEIDADERVSPALRASIEALLRDPPADVDMAVFALRNRFLGGALGPSAKYPAYRSRLFRRAAYRHDEARAVHEGLELRARPLILAGDLEHELAGTLREALHDTWRYARLESEHVIPPAGALGYLKGIVLRPAAKLLYRSVLEGGWRDGWRGLLKISLDVGSDVLVWTLVLGRRDDGAAVPGLGAARNGSGDGAALGVPGSVGDRSEGGARAGDTREGAAAHFGRRSVGPPKIVAVAAGAGASEQAHARLAQLQRRGADVALITDSPPRDCELPLQPVARVAPLGVIRALEAEMHLRPIDTVLGVGRRAQLVLRVIPASFRPSAPAPDERAGEPVR